MLNNPASTLASLSQYKPILKPCVGSIEALSQYSVYTMYIPYIPCRYCVYMNNGIEAV